MCSGSKSKVSNSNNQMESEMKKQKDAAFSRCSLLLELSASDELTAFKSAVEESNLDVDEASFWYCRRIGSKKMGFEERTPLMIAATYDSAEVLKYIIGTGKVDVNRACGEDKVTALHCAAAGGAYTTIKLLMDASADASCTDANGKRPIDHLSQRKAIDLLKEGGQVQMMKKEYPVDVLLPDINNGMYNTDEFRMFTFKVKPCSRAYSHDWTECPFVHPGENARRRDPNKYPYSCVPCPEFRKGSCPKADSCEYAHGVFESWLHPAQYRTRLCKDETGCARKVCFFAHKPEELRPVYASTGSAMPSPRQEMAMLSSLGLNSSAMAWSTTTATSSPPSSPRWQNKVNLTPPQGSRLKTAFNVRDLDMEMQLMDELTLSSSPSYWNRIGDINLKDSYGSPSYKSTTPTPNQMQSSPTGLHMRQNMSQVRASYPLERQASFGFDSSAAVAAAVMNSRSSAFAKRSQSFIDRGAMPHRIGTTTTTAPSNWSNWGSLDGRLDREFQEEELNKLRKSASFGFRSNNPVTFSSNVDEPDVSWVNSLVKDANPLEKLPLWVEQMYLEQEQMVA